MSQVVESRRDVQPISQPIAPRKQAAKRHYGSHPYFTKRAWNVVQKYIETFSEVGDTVLDPFGGSGVTAVEAVILGRQAIHVDIAPLANFITWGVAVSPVDIPAFQNTFGSLRDACSKEIDSLYSLSDAEIAAMPVPYWYPKDVRLPSNSDVEYVHENFHRRSLIGLSILLHHINQIEDKTLRELFRLVFAATLNKTNLTFSSTTGRKESRGDSAIFRVYRYWIPKKTIELNVWEQFRLRFSGWVAAKRETNDLIGSRFSATNPLILKASATDLRAEIASESVDYIYTDPPYGAHIAYLDLMTMWDAWLGFEVSESDRALEVIEGGERKKSKQEYVGLLGDSIDEMFRVLKWNRWLSLVFSHKDPAFWEAIVDAAQKAGFEYVNTAVQYSTTPSLHKRKNPLKVLSGELILNFRKVRNPRTIAITAMGADVVQLIKNTAELAIVRNDSATTEQVYNDLVPILLENGLLSVAKTEIADVTALLKEDFDFDPVGQAWRIRPDTKLGHFIPLEQRIRFYVTDYLKRIVREHRRATFDDVVFNVMPNLINGHQPTNDSILEMLQEIAYSPDGHHWELRAESEAHGQTSLTFAGLDLVPVLPTVADPPHDEIIYRLAKLALGASIQPHIGKKEQANQVNGEKLGTLSLPSVPAGLKLTKWALTKIEQIDCVFYSPIGLPQAAFEVEASTPITTGIDRFLELLKVAPTIAKRLFIVIPKQRVRKLDGILRDSHYIGHPLYMENKLVYLYYEDLLNLYIAFAGRKPPTSDQLYKRLDGLARSPKLQG
jgi:DNA modification methylase